MITEQPLLLMKPQRKPFCIIIFQSETCCKATLVRRYFSGKVSCHAIELIFIDYEHGCLASCKLHNNFLQISCCEFEYFSMNKTYTSRRRQRNERTKSQNELAWIYSAFMKISTPQQSTYPWEVFSEDLFAIFQAIYWGNCTWFNLPRLKAPFIWGTLFGSVNLN